MRGFDLCVLASSSHTIFAYGTFGQWGALLAGGQTVTAVGITPDADSEYDSYSLIVRTELLLLQI